MGAKSLNISPGSARLLLAEPDRAKRSAAKSVLMKLGYSRILEADSLEQARKSFLSCETNLIICNLQFPDGLASSLLQELRRMPESSNLPFVFLLNPEDEPLKARLAGIPSSVIVPATEIKTKLKEALLSFSNLPVEELPVPAAYVAESLEEESSQTEVKTEVVTVEGFQNLRVLILDSSAMSLKATQAAVTQLGVRQVIGVDNAKDALQAIERGEADFVLCELELKDLNGLGVLRKIRSSFESSNLPFSFLTSRAESEQVLSALRLRANDYLLKPLSKSLLAEMFNRVLRDELTRERTQVKYLDEKKAVETAQQLLKSLYSPAAGEKNQMPELRILLVDEDEKFRRICGSFLRRLGFKKVMETSSAASALKKLEGGLADLVFCEWSVCQVSGIEILRSIRSIGFLKDTPFIMVTEICSRERVLDALRAGVTDYLIKPCTAEVLAEALGRVVVDYLEREVKV